MTEEIDVNKIAVEFLQGNLERVLKGATSTAADAKNMLRARLQRTYRSYVSTLLERHARGKSFFIRSEPVPLYDFFVPLNLRTQRRTLRRPGVAELMKVAPHSVIIATGGGGKSMMMRHLLVSALKAGSKTPVLFDLRSLNHTDDSLKAALLSTMQVAGLDVDEHFLEIALEIGQFYVLLDGFDEVAVNARKKFAGEVQDLALRYPKNWITISSRPDTALEGWDTFTRFSLDPLDLDAAVELVTKVPFDDPVKERFIQDMKDRLFESHQSFLSNPLLLSIMLLTYSDVAHIPHKLSTFYSQAFEALFHRHDALKGGFQRERRSGLDIQDYSRGFSAFSLLSYDSREFSFTESRALELVGRARDLSMLSFDSNDFLQDAIQAICLLVEDGMEIAFAHRSFQEYFVARFVGSSPAELKGKLIERFAPGVESDAVMALLYEIDPFSVERYYIIPQLAELRRRIGVKRSVGMSHFLRYWRALYGELRIIENGSLGASVKEWPLKIAIDFIFKRYGDPESLVRDPGESVEAAFKAEFGDGAEAVSTSQLRLRGPFLAAVAANGNYWSRGFVQALVDIHTEICARHAENKQTLEQILANTRDRENHRRLRQS